MVRFHLRGLQNISWYRLSVILQDNLKCNSWLDYLSHLDGKGIVRLLKVFTVHGISISNVSLLCGSGGMADAPVLGTGALGVRVQVSPPAPLEGTSIMVFYKIASIYFIGQAHTARMTHTNGMLSKQCVKKYRDSWRDSIINARFSVTGAQQSRETVERFNSSCGPELS